MPVPGPGQPPTAQKEASSIEPNPTEGTQPAEPGRPESERKPHVTPRLVEHGKIAKTTLGSSGPLSDRDVKDAFEAVDPRRVLTAALTLPIERYAGS
jgi:hypothetical protein